MSIALARPGQSITESFLYNSPYPNTPQTGRSGTAGLRAASPSAADLPSSLPVDPARSVRSAEKGLLRKEGEYWTGGYDGRVFRLKDTKGLAYLTQLLCSPGTDFHALDLAGGAAGHSGSREDEAQRSAAALPQRAEELQSAGIRVGGLGDAGELLDEPAKAAYCRRLAELRAEVAEAKQLDQFERAEQAEEEIEALLTELAHAVGLSGRDRRAASAAERARQSVSRALKTVVQRIAEHDPALGALFLRCIKTGAFCSYTPDPTSSIAWEFGVTRRDAAPAPPKQTPSGGPSDRPRADEGIAATGEFLVSRLFSAHRTTFVGREAECDQLRSLVDRVLTGQGAQLVRVIFAETQGNPFFVEEVY